MTKTQITQKANRALCLLSKPDPGAGDAEVWWSLYSNIMLHTAETVACTTFLREHSCLRIEGDVYGFVSHGCLWLTCSSPAADGSATRALCTRLYAGGGTDPASCFPSSDAWLLVGSRHPLSHSSKSQAVRQKGCVNQSWEEERNALSGVHGCSNAGGPCWSKQLCRKR